eukprot:scaffold9387_cov84-Isochrysis_galbana.AAC.1
MEQAIVWAAGSGRMHARARGECIPALCRALWLWGGGGRDGGVKSPLVEAPRRVHLGRVKAVGRTRLKGGAGVVCRGTRKVWCVCVCVCMGGKGWGKCRWHARRKVAGAVGTGRRRDGHPVSEAVGDACGSHWFLALPPAQLD